MELKEFISNTIEQIALGVMDLQSKSDVLNIIVNPNVTVGGDGDFSIPKKPEHVTITNRVTLIKMDVALVVNENEGAKIGGKVGISVFSIGSDVTSDKTVSNSSKVSFSIPVVLPSTDVTKTS